jgi:hypothetical protein
MAFDALFPVFSPFHLNKNGQPSIVIPIRVRGYSFPLQSIVIPIRVLHIYDNSDVHREPYLSLMSPYVSYMEKEK